MSTRKHAVFFAATLCAVVTASSAASAANPAPHVPTPVAAPDQKPAAAPKAPLLQRLSAAVAVLRGSAPSKLPTHLDMKSSPTKGTAQPADVAPREVVFRGGAHIDGAIQSLIDGANATGIPHKGSFNGREFVARPGDTLVKVRKPFDDEMEAGRKKYEAQQAEAEKVRAQKIAAFTKPLVRTPPPGMKLDPRGKWNDSLMLITPAQMKELPEGTVLRSIVGRDVIVGIDYIDGDTRGGFTAFGFEPTGATGK